MFVYSYLHIFAAPNPPRHIQNLHKDPWHKWHDRWSPLTKSYFWLRFELTDSRNVIMCLAWLKNFGKGLLWTSLQDSDWMNTYLSMCANFCIIWHFPLAIQKLRFAILKLNLYEVIFFLEAIPFSCVVSHKTFICNQKVPAVQVLSSPPKRNDLEIPRE